MTPCELILRSTVELDRKQRSSYEAALSEIKNLNEKLDVSDRANAQMLGEIKRLNIEIETLRQIISNYHGCLT